MDQSTCDTPDSVANYNNNNNNNNTNSCNLLTGLFKSEHPGAIQSLSEGKVVEQGNQECDQQVESSLPITAQPNTTFKTNDAQDDSMLYQAAIEVVSQDSLEGNNNAATNTAGSATNSVVNSKKPTPKRAMVLLGRPAPTLPPRPVFPTDLENYHLESGTVESTQHMQSYLLRVRQDFDQQTQHYEALKEALLGDTHHVTAIVDELDAMDEDPFTLDSFENLMRMHASKGKDFIIARVTTQDPNDENKHYHSYYGAHQINKVLFRTQPDEGLLHRMKARNPLNNMLVVGDVHYYIISAADVNTVRPLSTVRSSSASITSHSSRMSRCSKLAAQAIASQSASARSSPILGSDMSLFSRSSDVESPVSIISPLMALSILKADQEDPLLYQRVMNGGGPSVSVDHGAVQPHNPRRRGSQGATSSVNSSATSTPTFAQGVFHQPGRPSRLRQAIETEDQQDPRPGSPVMAMRIMDSVVDAGSSSAEGVPQDRPFCPMTPPIHNQHQQYHSQASPSSSAAGQSPLFQSLMGGRVRSRSNTVSSISSDRSSTSTMSARSHQSHVSKCSTASNDSTNSTNDRDGDSNIIYKFRYLASDDDFLLRSTVRQTFKVNALESWDAILFTISNNALREYSSQGGEQVLQPLGSHQHPLPLPPSSPLSAQAQPQQQSLQESLPTPTTAAAAVAAQYSAHQNQGQTITPAPLTVHLQDSSPLNHPATENYYHLSDPPSTNSNSNNNSNNNTAPLGTQDPTPTTPPTPHDRRTGGGLYSAGVNGVSRGFDIHSFSHNPHRHGQSLEEHQQGRDGRVEGLGRSMSYCSRRVDLFRSLPALPLGVSSKNAIGGGGEGCNLVDGEMMSESMRGGSGSESIGGGRKKLRRVLSKIFSRK
ncbi:hypothetical protein EC991_005467 [Linnemannia zychae]|nr:hypothetical protein EC991_005467 [Linnemannia zychae]